MSACQIPAVTIPSPSDILAAIIAALAALGISIPPMPTIPVPVVPCPLD